MAYGEPRFTNDIDIFVDVRLEHRDLLMAAFPPPDHYLAESAPRLRSSVTGSSTSFTFRLVSYRDADEVGQCLVFNALETIFVWCVA